MSLKSQIPNLLTLSNLIFGVLSIYFSATNHPEIGAWLILAAAGFDFLDGLAARALRVSGELGKQLDSLADVISFGVGPVFLALQFNGVFEEEFHDAKKAAVLFIPIIMAAFSAYRLGKFNIDDRQTGGFLGLPTPANALFWVGLALADSGGLLEAPFLIEFWENSKNSTGLVGFISLLLGLLLIAEVPLLALKFKGFGFAENAAKYILIGSGIVLFLLFGFASVPIILLLYFIISLIAKNDIQS